jgi:hypothetical protein
MSPTQPLPSWRGRWILTGALLALTLLSAVLIQQALPPLYQSGSSVVLLASPAVSKPNGGNPYLSFTPSLTLTADVLSRELMAPATAQYLAWRGYRDPYTVALAPTTTQATGSVLEITVTGGDPAGVERTLRAVTGEVGTRLARMESGVGQAGRIRVLTLSLTQQPAVSVSHLARSLALVGGLGLLLSLGVPWLVDAQVTQRRLREGQRAAPAGRADGDWPEPSPASIFPLLTGGRRGYHDDDDDPGPA